MEQIDKKQQKKKFLHIASVIALIGGCIIFYVFGGGTAETTNATDNSEGLNMAMPDAVGNIEEDKLSSIDKVTREENEQSTRSQKEDQASSFSWMEQQSSKAQTPQKKEQQRLNELSQKSDALLSSLQGRTTPEAPRQTTPQVVTTKKTTTTRKSSTPATETDYDTEQQAKMRIYQKRAQEQEIAYKKAMGVEVDETKPTENEQTSTQEEKAVTKKKGFYGVGTTSSKNINNIRAIVHGEQTNLTSGSIVKLRLLDDIIVSGVKIPHNSFVYGRLSFSKSRAMITVENINYNDNVIPFKGAIYDKDGFEGLHVPDNAISDTKKQATSNAVSDLDVNVSSTYDVINTGVNAVSGAIKSAISGAAKEAKVSISSNYLVTIKRK